MASYPIWNRITACNYKGGKSYCVRETGEVTVLVGTSASNSHLFLKHCVTHRELEDGSREYRFYLDGVVLKRAVLPKGADQLDFDQIPLKNA